MQYNIEWVGTKMSLYFKIINKWRKSTFLFYSLYQIPHIFALIIYEGRSLFCHFLLCLDIRILKNIITIYTLKHNYNMIFKKVNCCHSTQM